MIRENAHTALTEQEKWDAVLRRQSEAGQSLLYGVRTTMVYCLPSCRSKIPLRKNVVFFSSPIEAEEKGYRPCKRCRPDANDEGRKDAQMELVKSIFDRLFDDRVELASELQKIDVAKTGLAKRFGKIYGTTPTRYLTMLRTDKASGLLLDSEKSLLTIAEECGFGSVPSFYASFRSRFGMTPKEYRAKGPERGH